MTKIGVFSFLLVAALGSRIARADDAADIQKFLVFFDKVTVAVVADKDACPKMATDVNKLIDASQDIIDTAKKAVAAGKKLPADAQKHMMDDVQKMLPGMQACGSNKDVQAAFQRMQVRPSPKK